MLHQTIAKMNNQITIKNTNEIQTLKNSFVESDNYKKRAIEFFETSQGGTAFEKITSWINTQTYKHDTAKKYLCYMFAYVEFVSNTVIVKQIKSKAYKHLSNVCKQTHARVCVKQAKAIKKGEVHELINTIKEQQYKTIFALMFWGAFRVSEITKLRLENIQQTDKGFIIQLAGVYTKTGAELYKFIPTNTAAHEQLTVWLKTRKNNEYLFYTKNDNQLSRVDIHRKLKTQNTALQTHSFRAGAITTAAQNGATISEIQALSGHKSIQMIQTYTRSEDITKNNAVSKL